jgi:hypothetical protein
MKNKQGNHLDEKEYLSALFDLPENISKRITGHLSKCGHCRKLVEREKRINPIYLELIKHRASGKTDEEFWKEIEKIGDEIAEDIINIALEEIFKEQNN